MEKLLGIQPYAFEPIYYKDEGVSVSKNSDLEGKSNSERVGNTDWCGCEVCVSLSEGKHICCHEWYILDDKLEVEDVECVLQRMDLGVTYLNHSVLATSYVAFMQVNGIGGRAPAILYDK